MIHQEYLRYTYLWVIQTSRKATNCIPIKKIARHIAVYRCLSQCTAVMSGIYCDYFGARHLIGDDHTAILLLLTTVSDDFPTVVLRFFLIGIMNTAHLFLFDFRNTFYLAFTHL